MYVINMSRENNLRGWSIGGTGTYLSADVSDNKDVLCPCVLLKTPYECTIQSDVGEDFKGRFALVVENDFDKGPVISRCACFVSDDKAIMLGKNHTLDWHNARDIYDDSYKVTGNEWIGDGANYLERNKKNVESLLYDVRKKLVKNGDLKSFGWFDFKRDMISKDRSRIDVDISKSTKDYDPITIKFVPSKYVRQIPGTKYLMVSVPVSKDVSETGFVRCAALSANVFDRSGISRVGYAHDDIMNVLLKKDGTWQKAEMSILDVKTANDVWYDNFQKERLDEAKKLAQSNRQKYEEKKMRRLPEIGERVLDDDSMQME